VAKYEVLIKAVTVQGLSYRQVAARYGVSKSLVHKLHHRWLVEGDAAFEARSRRPRSSPNRTPQIVRDRILILRDELVADGLDAGADTISELLARNGIQVSRVTVWRILTASGRVVPQPQKRPRSSWRRFAADRPNELWQSDFTHVILASGVEVEIIGWLDDHSRYLLHLSVHRRVTARIVIDTFTATAREHGYPAATLTDNGMVYTTRYAGGRGGRNHLEHELRRLDIVQKNGRPNHPTTCGKVERFQQTLKKWLRAQPVQPTTIAELQTLLDAFAKVYNHDRPHRSLQHRATPATAYQARPKATPTGDRSTDSHDRVRHDTVSKAGNATLRIAGRLRHIGLGRTYARTRVILLVQDLDIRVINAATGELLRELTINPALDYQPRTPK
jgi:transposase InsO family protein